MAGFLDYVDEYLGSNGIPAWLTGMLVKKPNSNPSDALPYFGAVGGLGAAAGQQASDNAAFTDANYKPAAVDFNRRAQGVGGSADLNEAADRGAANFQGAFGAARKNAMRSMSGVNPNSGASQARLGAIDASYAPGIVDAMNKGRTDREKMGYQLRASALPFLNMPANFGQAGALYAGAGSGTLGASREVNNQYRLQAGDVMKSLKMPWDTQDEKSRTTAAAGGVKGPLSTVANWLSGRTAAGVGQAQRVSDDTSNAYEGSPFKYTPPSFDNYEPQNFSGGDNNDFFSGFDD